MLQVIERFHWVAPSGMTVAIHCVPPAGSVRKSMGFRIVRDGKVLFPSSLPFKTRNEAERRMVELACA